MARTSSPKSEIDRLIDLASSNATPGRAAEEIPPAPHESSNRSLSLEDQKDPRPSMWRVLLQLRVLLPYLARVLPLLERGLLGTAVLSGGGNAPAGHDTSHFDREFEELQGANRDLTQQLRELANLSKSQIVEIQSLQDQVSAVNASVEKASRRHTEIAESIESLDKRVKGWAIAILVVLLGLIGAVVYLILNRPA
jgi:hypothetical protein